MSLIREARRMIAYGFASAVALGFDMGSYLLLIGAGMAAPLAAVSGYSLGIVIHWLASSRVVFAGRVAEKGRGRSMQMGLFVASALVGLSLTWVIVSMGVASGIDPRLAKLSAVATSFVATFLLRARFVFTLRGVGAPADEGR
jgi:putative flippase GtrA